MLQIETIYVVFKTHVDIGFTGLAKEVVQSYRSKMIDDVLKVCESTQKYGEAHQYVWTMPSWLLHQTLQNITGERQKRIETLVEQDQLVWHALPFTTHTEFCGLEEFIRGMYFSKQLADRYDKNPPISAKMTDVPGHTWMLPSILYKAGVRFLHLGCNACSTPPDVPRLFYWEGPDGNRVLTYYSKGGYGTDLIPPDDWPYPVWFALQQTHDNIGPQSDEIVEEILAELQKKAPGANVVLGSMDDFAHDILQRDLSDIPVIKKDLADTWIHGVGTYPEEVSAIRRLRTELATLESYFTLQQMQPNSDAHDQQAFQQAIQTAYEQMLLFGEHTWGLDMKITLLPLRDGERVYEKEKFLLDKQSAAYKRAEASWDEQRSYVCEADKAIQNIRPVISKNNSLIRVYNPLPWTRNNEDLFLENVQSGMLTELENGETHLIERSGRGGKVTVGQIPPVGYKTFQYTPVDTLEKNKSKKIAIETETNVVLENRWVIILIDRKSGEIISLYDKKGNKEWIDSQSGIGFGEYLYDIYGKEDLLRFMKDYAYDLTDWYVNDFGKAGYPCIQGQTYYATLGNISIENGWDWGRVVITKHTHPESYEKYGNAQTIRTCITLKEDQKGADICYTLHEKQETPFLEAGHFVFPLKTQCPQYRLEKMGSVINPLTDIQPKANIRLHSCDQWIDVQDGKLGIGFIPIDSPLVSIGEQGVLQYADSYDPQQSTLYFNVFNNQWGTNFPQWMGGTYAFEFRIALHEGSWHEGGIWKSAAETRYPLTAIPMYPEQTMNNVFGLFKKDLRGMKVLAFKPSDIRDGSYILRMQDLLGESRTIALSFQNKFGEVIVCDLVEREMEKLQLDGESTVAMPIKPFEILTLKLVPLAP